MPERRDADLFEILIGQFTQNIEINIILGKALSVLPETELFEPVRNLLHRRLSTDLALPFWTGMSASLPTLAKIEYSLGPGEWAPWARFTEASLPRYAALWQKATWMVCSIVSSQTARRGLRELRSVHRA
jgi:hypothetical protein